LKDYWRFSLARLMAVIAVCALVFSLMRYPGALFFVALFAVPMIGRYWERARGGSGIVGSAFASGAAAGVAALFAHDSRVFKLLGMADSYWWGFFAAIIGFWWGLVVGCYIYPIGEGLHRFTSRKGSRRAERT
jgi:hypothetical protein